MIEISLLFYLNTVHVPKWDTIKEYQSIASMIKAFMAPPADADEADSDEETEGATFEEGYFQNIMVLPP
jgi:hypothetical protein